MKNRSSGPNKNNALQAGIVTAASCAVERFAHVERYPRPAPSDDTSECMHAMPARDVGQSPTAAQRKPAHFEIPPAWIACALVAANARPGYAGNRAIDVEVLPAGKHYVAHALIREGSRHMARLVGDFCPTELQALHCLEPLLVRYAGGSL